MWSNVYINIFLEKTYIYIFDSSIAKGRRQKLYIERPASVKEIPSMLTELADLFMFLWWNLTLSHQCSCYYFSRLILVFNNFTMLFLPYQPTVSIHSRAHMVTQESRNLRVQYFEGVRNGVECECVYRDDCASIYVSVCICSVIHDKK